MMSIVLTVKSVISYTFYYSCKVGQFIVTSVNLLLTSLLSFITKVFLLLYILLEDFTIFIQDVLQRIDYIVGRIAHIGECIVFGGYALSEKIQDFYHDSWRVILNLLQSVFDGVATGVNGIRSIFVFIKHVIVLFGEGVWFIVIFIPKSLLSLGPITVDFLYQSCVQICDSVCAKAANIYKTISDSINSCYCFVTDVPTESLIGLIIALCFLYIFMQFYAILFTYFRNKVSVFVAEVRLMYHQLKQVVNITLSRCMRQIKPRLVHVESKPSTSFEACSKTDKYCVVCQDREKCILVLPCKHLCLCIECTEQVMYHSGSCPICRKHIQRTMKVFT